MDAFPFSERLAFRRWNAQDADLAAELWGDPVVATLIGGPFTRQQIGERLQRELDSDVRWGVQYWPIFERITGQFVGCCGLRPYRPDERVLELGFHLLPKHWGKGLAREAAHAVTCFAFEQIGAIALFAGHHPANAASRELLKRLGFAYTHSEIYPPTGLEHPSYLLHARDFAMGRSSA